MFSSSFSTKGGKEQKVSASFFVFSWHHRRHRKKQDNLTIIFLKYWRLIVLSEEKQLVLSSFFLFSSIVSLTTDYGTTGESEMDGFGIERSVVDKGQEIVGDIKYFIEGLVS